MGFSCQGATNTLPEPFFISTIISLDYISVLNNFPIYAQGYYF